MTLHVSVSGVNKRVLGIWVGVGGAWKKVLTGHTSIAGVFKKFFSAGNVVSPLAGGILSSIAYNGVGNSTTMTLNSNGSISADTGGVLEGANVINGTRWFTDTPDQAYEAFAFLDEEIGNGTTFGVFESWVSLSSSPSWGVSRSGGTNGARGISFRIKIRRASDSVEVSPYSNTYTLSAGTRVGAQP